MASQYNYAFGPTGWSGDFTKPNSDTKWNDVFVWPDKLDNPGISIDSGMVFLPSSTQVDPATGSKYASEIRTIDGQEKRVMIENTELMHSFIGWGKTLSDQSPIRLAITQWFNERTPAKQQDLEQDCFRATAQELQSLGFDVETAGILGRKFARESFYYRELTEDVLQTMLQETNANWKRAENTVSAKQYWEDYFAKNPHLKPKHIVYYDGDPTVAILEFQQRNGIGSADTSKTEGPLLGFDDHRLLYMKDNPDANPGYDDLVAMANKIIEERYRNQGITNFSS